jgi:hypothetical protein
MKNVLYLCLAVCLCTTLAFAQKVTNKELQGNWKMTGFNTQGIGLDLKTQEVTISPELQAQLTPEAITGIKEGMKQAIEPLSASYVNFKGNTMKLAVGPEAETGDFTLTEKDGKQSLALKNADGTTTDLPVMMKDKLLYLTLSDKGQTADFIFRKE